MRVSYAYNRWRNMNFKEYLMRVLMIALLTLCAPNVAAALPAHSNHVCHLLF